MVLMSLIDVVIVYYCADSHLIYSGNPLTDRSIMSLAKRAHDLTDLVIFAIMGELAIIAWKRNIIVRKLRCLSFEFD